MLRFNFWLTTIAVLSMISVHQVFFFNPPDKSGAKKECKECKGHDKEGYNFNISETTDIAEDDEDMSFLKKARWSYAPGFVEVMCRKSCQAVGKPFGRLIATRCQCLCPLNAADLNLCSRPGICDVFCASIGHFKGGDCVFNNICFCYCKKHEKYDVRKVYTAEDD